MHKGSSRTILFHPRQCVRITVVDPLFYRSFALFGACILSDQVVAVSEVETWKKSQSWQGVIDAWVAGLKHSGIRDVVDVVCIKETCTHDTWCEFTDDKEENKRVERLRRLFKDAAQKQQMDLRIFPYLDNRYMVDGVQAYVEEMKQVHI